MNWLGRVRDRVLAYFDPDYLLMRDVANHRWPWPTADRMSEIKFRIALSKLLKNSEALNKSIQDWNNTQGVTKR